ncbi:MAG: SIS domain-containing protein [Cellulomonas sp.]
MAMVLDGSALWADTLEVPESLSRTIDALASDLGTHSAPGLLRQLVSRSPRRLLITGNGAAYYAGLALWTAALRSPLAGAEVVPVPAGLFASSHVHTGPGDVLVIVSSSGELRDLIEALPTLHPDAVIVVTANAGSTLARAADAVVVTQVLHQRAVSHTQAFVANVVALLAVWAQLTHDDALGAAVAAAPELAAESLVTAAAWGEEHGALVATWRGGITVGEGGALSAALETALLLREVAAIPTEGMESREGATTGMYALGTGQGVVGAGGGSRVTREALAVCRRTGADVLELPWPPACPAGLEPVAALAPAVALAVAAGLARGLDVDNPPWTSTYFSTARVPTEASE